jgi:hypothetical protein
MSDRNGATGKVPRRKPRTPSHAPPERPPERSPARPAAYGMENPSGEAADATTGLQDAHVSHVGNVGASSHTPAGKFAPGNRLGRGNPNARRVHELRLQFLDAVHPDTIPALARRLQVQALNGDLDSMKLLLDYTLGKPAQAVALTDADGGPLGFNFHQVTAVVLDALADDPARRIEVAARLMELETDDARDADA